MTLTRPISPDNGAQTVVAKKFSDPDRTLGGDERARVALQHLDTLWINTGSLCNITCANCYIESSPKNDRLVYIPAAEARRFLDEAKAAGTREIGFTGGEPFLNPEILTMLSDALGLGFEVLVLTNAMLPMQRPRLKKGLADFGRRYPGRMTFRVSLDHHTQALHETERGPRTWKKAIDGTDWLAANGFRLAIAGRTRWGESEADARAGYARLFAEHDWSIDAFDPARTILFPEMDGSLDVPEISTKCWGILNKSPSSMMCATSRMVIKRRDAEGAVVVPCTLLPYDTAFEMGTTLAASSEADGGMFAAGAVKLCHPHCAKFCVLGGGSCS